MKKTIFVIGATSALAKEAINVLAVHNTVITGGRKNCDVYCDITRPIDLPSAIDVVINFAAAFGGSEDTEIMEAVKTNVLGMLHVCIASKKAAVSHIIHISSLSALHDKRAPYYSAYALTKKDADDLADLYCALNKMPLTIIRPSQVYGDDISFAAHQPFFYQIIDMAEKGHDIAIYGKNDALRNYIHITDLSELISRIVSQRIVGTYPCLYPTNVRFSQIAQTAQNVFKRGGKIHFVRDKPSIPDNVFDMDLTIYEKADYQPQVTLQAGITSIRAYREGIGA
jgi:nucleoside-diphosphate-sugar epimerase